MNLAVIMSIYINDRLEFVSTSIESILAQKYSCFDLYILFDGIIRDEVRDYIYNIHDKRLHLIERTENRGLAISLNELLQIVIPKNYDFIARMDADDIALEDRFKKQIDYMVKNPDIDCLGSWAIEINNQGTEYFRKQMPETHKACLEMFKKRDCLIHPTVLFRSCYFKKAGLYPEDTYFGEDTMMWAKGFVNGCRFGNIPEYLLKFRLDNNFFKRRRGYKHAKSIFQLRKKVNKMLGFGYKEDIYAVLYAFVKLMPESVLNFLYKTIR